MIKEYKLKDVIEIAHGLMACQPFVRRSKAVVGIQSKNEKSDEQFWTDSESLKSDLQVVSLTQALWNPLKVRRPDLFSRSCNGTVTSQIKTSMIPGAVPDFPMDCRFMSYCCEFLGCNPHRAEIRIRNADNRLCYNRFLWAKELAHLYTETVTGDVEKNRSFLADLLQEEALDGTRFIDSADAVLSPEAVGFYLAIEILVPWCLREQIDQIKESNQNSNWSIARAFLVPQFVIRHIREDHFRKTAADEKKINYLALSKEIHTERFGLKR